MTFPEIPENFKIPEIPWLFHDRGNPGLAGQYAFLFCFFHFPGLLIEPNPATFKNLTKKRRNSWLLNACLSPVNKIQKVQLQMGKRVYTLKNLK